jgi:hypothetical protein
MLLPWSRKSESAIILICCKCYATRQTVQHTRHDMCYIGVTTMEKLSPMVLHLALAPSLCPHSILLESGSWLVEFVCVSPDSLPIMHFVLQVILRLCYICRVLIKLRLLVLSTFPPDGVILVLLCGPAILESKNFLGTFLMCFIILYNIYFIYVILYKFDTSETVQFFS